MLAPCRWDYKQDRRNEVSESLYTFRRLVDYKLSGTEQAEKQNELLIDIGIDTEFLMLFQIKYGINVEN